MLKPNHRARFEGFPHVEVKRFHDSWKAKACLIRGANRTTQVEATIEGFENCITSFVLDQEEIPFRVLLAWRVSI